MFTAYFDAGGDDHQQIALAVCGFIAHADAWISWRPEWLKRLAEDNLADFHGTELRGLPKDKRIRLIEDLSRITASHVSRKIAVAIVNADVKAVMSENERKEWRAKSYSIAGRTAAADARQWTANWGGPVPELVYEKGDVGSGDLTYLLESQAYPSPIFKPKRRQIDRKSGIALEPAIELQSADLLAGEVFRRIRDYEVDGSRERLPENLDKIPGEPSCIRAANLRSLRDMFEQGADALIHVPTVKINLW